MSRRYEWTRASLTAIACVPPGEEIGEHETDTWALVIGDPSAFAMVIQGDRNELILFTGRVAAEIASTLIAEQENGVYHSDETGRPGCADEATEVEE